MKFKKLSLMTMLCVCYACCCLGAYEYKLAVAAIFRDEAPYLREWIEYYKLQGAGHFYLYNNLSQDNYAEVLAPYIASGEVDLIEWTHEPANWDEWDKIQVAAYADALRLANNKATWLAILDIDEYVVPIVRERAASLKPSANRQNQLMKMLVVYEGDAKIGGVCIPWVFFGTSHVAKIPADQLLIETLLLNSGPAAGGIAGDIWNQGAYKSIVRPEFVAGICSPHYCGYVKGREHILLGFEKAQINHYWTRDEYFLHQVKIPRRGAWKQSADSVLGWAAGMNSDTPYGKPILKYVDALRKRMGLPVKGHK